MKYEDLPYRPNVGIALFNKEGLVFVAERIEMDGAWQMPQGGIDANEDIEIAALRELKEEIGTDNAEILKVHDQKICYDFPQNLLGTGHEGHIGNKKRYRGQEQVWVAMRFLGADSEIDLETEEEPEFGRWKWAKLHDTPAMIVDFKRDVYKQVVKAFEEFSKL